MEGGQVHIGDWEEDRHSIRKQNNDRSGQIKGTVRILGAPFSNLRPTLRGD